MVLGNIKGGLYQLNNSPINSILAVFYSSPENNSIWHRRLGHIPSRIMFNIYVFNKNCNTQTVVTPCNVFPLVKQFKLPFTSSQSHDLSSFDLAHYDVWGPL